MTRLIILNVILILLTSCSGKGKKEVYNPKAIELNNKAVLQMQKFNDDSALILFDKAIEIDKTYYLPHANKAGIYVRKKEFEKALAECEMAVTEKPDYAEEWTVAGMLHYGLGDTLTAKTYFKKSVEIFDNRILTPEEKEHIFANKMNRAVSLILLGQEKDGKEELKKLKAENPDNNVLGHLLNRNRQDYINDIFKNGTVTNP
jgi:Tfp pilus assembly protein PilF